MARTPGILNPLAFDSDDEFKAELAKIDKAAGYTPSPTEYPDDLDKASDKKAE